MKKKIKFTYTVHVYKKVQVLKSSITMNDMFFKKTCLHSHLHNLL